MADEITFTDEQQKFVDRLVGDARVKAREVAEAKLKADADVAAEEAEQKRLAGEKEWQKLADMHSGRVKELEPFEAEAKAYRELIDGMLKDKVKSLGDAAKKAVAALPEGMSAAEKLNWLSANEELFEDKSRTLGTPPKKQKSVADKDPRAGHKKARL